MQTFNVTYERISELSAAFGEVEERGFVARNVTLREALDAIASNAPQAASLECIEPNDSEPKRARWLSWIYGREYYDGDVYTYALCFPDELTPASRARVARLVGAN